jgi:hypothetical protein
VALVTASSNERIGGAEVTLVVGGGAPPAGAAGCGCGDPLSQPAASAHSNALLTVRREIGAILAMERVSKPGRERCSPLWLIRITASVDRVGGNSSAMASEVL